MTTETKPKPAKEDQEIFSEETFVLALASLLYINDDGKLTDLPKKESGAKSLREKFCSLF